MSKTFDTVDPACYELACYYLDECPKATEGQKHQLAARIQTTIEEYGKELMDEEEALYEDL